MAKVCVVDITGKRPSRRNNVSHAKTTRQRRFYQNLHRRLSTFLEEDAWITFESLLKALKNYQQKTAITAVLKKAQENGDDFVIRLNHKVSLSRP